MASRRLATFRCRPSSMNAISSSKPSSSLIARTTNFLLELVVALGIVTVVIACFSVIAIALFGVPSVASSTYFPSLQICGVTVSAEVVSPPARLVSVGLGQGELTAHFGLAGGDSLGVGLVHLEHEQQEPTAVDDV